MQRFSELSQKHRDEWVPVFQRIIELSRDEGTFMIEVAKVLASELPPSWEDKRDRIMQRISELSRDDRSMFMIEVAKLFVSFASYEPEQPPAWMDEKRVACFVDQKIDGWPLLWEYPKPSPPARTGRRGRPKMSEELRRAKNPIHSAAEEFYMICRVLRQFYPSKSRSTIRNRAITLAEERNSVQPESLDTHLRRTKKNRRRVPLRVVF
jgi:hypothetical protein